jgi:hypothetical protein
MEYGTVRRLRGVLSRTFRKRSKKTPLPQEQAMADRAVLPLKNGKLDIEIMFYHAEADLFRLGPEAYIEMLARTATNKLNDAGAIGPYLFFCTGGDGNVSPFIFRGQEQ